MQLANINVVDKYISCKDVFNELMYNIFNYNYN